MTRRKRPTRVSLSEAYKSLAQLADRGSLSEETRRLLLLTLGKLDKELDLRPMPDTAEKIEATLGDFDDLPTEPSAVFWATGHR